VEVVLKRLLYDSMPREMVTRGLDRREARRAAEAASALAMADDEPKKKR